MMTMTTSVLSGPSQTLIDARLDTIDRMLMGRVSRSDRLEIVREVESQIQELLSDREPSTVSREDVLDVLRRLDPPEAYIPEGVDDDQGTYVPRLANAASDHKRNPKESGRIEGLIGGAAGVVSFVLLLAGLAMNVMANLGEEEEPNPFYWALFALSCVLGIASNVFAFVFSIRGRHQGAWPIIGLIFGLISLPIWIYFGLVLLQYPG